MDKWNIKMTTKLSICCLRQFVPITSAKQAAVVNDIQLLRHVPL